LELERGEHLWIRASLVPLQEPLLQLPVVVCRTSLPLQ
jgi:hypothetical protein